MTDATLKDHGVRAGRISLPAIPSRSRSRSAGSSPCWWSRSLAEKIAPYGFTQLDLRNRLAAPGNVAHWLGTDELGRDVLSRLIVSIRISLLIAFGATAISADRRHALGFLAAHFRGLVEQLVLMLADFQASMPFLILALAVLAFFGNSLPLLDRPDGAVTAGSAMPASPAAWRSPPTRRAMPRPSGSSARRRRGSICAISCPTSPRP